MKLKLIYPFSVFTILIWSCNWSPFVDNSPNNILYKDHTFNLLHPMPMAFEKDTIYPDLFFSTLNVDGDILRVLRFYSKKDTLTFPLVNAVNNNTEISCYSLKIKKKRYLWVEDNFGTFVLDIDLKKVKGVTSPKRELSKIAPTGAPMGTKNNISKSYIIEQLSLKRNTRIKFLDSLHFKM